MPDAPAACSDCLPQPQGFAAGRRWRPARGDLSEVHRFVDLRRASFGLTAWDFPVDPLALLRRYDELEVRLRSMSFGGYLLRGPVNLLLLNERHSPTMRRFYAAHELMHFWLDGGASPIRYEPSTDGWLIHQDPYVEWRANEGAAELLVARDSFLPLAAGEALTTWGGSIPALLRDRVWRARAAALYDVSAAVIYYRLLSLRGQLTERLQETAGPKEESACAY